MELLVHFVCSQYMYLNDLNSDAKFYLHSFDSFSPKHGQICPKCNGKSVTFSLKPHIYFSVRLKGVFSYTWFIISFKVTLFGL